jgi:cell division protein FtsL
MLQKWMPLWAIPALMMFAMGTVWQRLAIVRTAYAIHQTDRDIQHARQEREQLQLKVAALRSPRRLEALARTKFGMSQPRMEQVIHLKKTELLGNVE